MSIRLTRNRTAAFSTLLLLVVGASTSFFLSPAPGESAKKEISETAALDLGQKKAPVAVPGQFIPSSDQQAAITEQEEVVDLSVVYPPEGKNPTDDPLALFNTPIVETP